MTSTSYENRLLRHRSVQASVKPSAAALQAMVPAIRKCVSRARFKFRTVFQAMGLETDDLVNLGLVHSIYFLDRHDYRGNEGLFFYYLSQRLAEAAKITAAKSVNCSPDALGSEVEVDVVDPAPGTDAEYADGCFQLFRGDRSCFLEIRSTESLMPTIYVDGYKISESEISEIRTELDTKMATIVAIEPDKVPYNDQKLAMAYVALNPDIDAGMRSTALQVCRKKFGIRYNEWRPRFQELQALVRSNGLLPPDFERLHSCRPPGPPRSEFKEIKDSLRADLMGTAKKKRCHQCERRLGTTEFSIKIMRNSETGVPDRAIFCSYCKACKRVINDARKETLSE